ncbi:MAG TPA: porin [Nitrospiraceae bacterium]|nr:porin [Nitrospiraceae bacterium]
MTRQWFATILCVIGLGLIVQAGVAQANIEDILYEKGQITKEEWLKTKADHEKEEAIIQQQAATKKWYDKISIRGYIQLRYNVTDDRQLVSEYDSSIGNNKGFQFRRVRLVFSGDVTDWLSIYIQPEFGTSAGTGNNNFAQLRDAYADIFLPMSYITSSLTDKELRIRAGQSKVPFGFENLQSSQQRLALDRVDGLNSAVNGERDIGFFLYYTPTETKKLFRSLIEKGLKGSGDYGVLGIGVYNGQTLNVSEANDNKHVVLHATYPFELPYGQILQVGADAYKGLVNVTTAPGTGVTVPAGNVNVNDERVGAHLVLYPQPIGFQAEWNWGRGPQLNDARTAIQDRSLHGGYVQAMYKWNDAIPYVRYQEYYGGKKHRTNSPFNVVRELEVGLEYQFSKALEFTVAYAWMMKRTDTINAPYLPQDGEVLRFQLQWNY